MAVNWEWIWLECRPTQRASYVISVITPVFTFSYNGILLRALFAVKRLKKTVFLSTTHEAHSGYKVIRTVDSWCRCENDNYTALVAWVNSFNIEYAPFNLYSGNSRWRCLCGVYLVISALKLCFSFLPVKYVAPKPQYRPSSRRACACFCLRCECVMC